MKVVRIVTRLNRGGPTRQLLALVPGLARLGIEGPVWTGAPERGEEDCADLLRAAGVDVVRVPGLRRTPRPADDLRAFRWMLRRLRDERPDVVHTHMAKAGALGRTAARLAGVSVRVHTFHGHHLTAGFPKGAAAARAESALAAISSALVCQSKRQRADLVDRFRVIPADKAVVIAPGIDLAALAAAVDVAKAAALRAQHAPAGATLFLWLGRFVPVKDPLLLLEAFARAFSSDAPPARLVLAGEGPLRAAAESRAAALRVRDRVVFPGPVSDAATWIRAADVVVLSSRSEGTPVSLVEAQALGVPVVAPAVGGVPDVVLDGESGLLVPPGDSAALAAVLRTLASDPASRARMGERGRSFAHASFSGDRLARETADLYRRVTATKPSRDGPEGASRTHDR